MRHDIRFEEIKKEELEMRGKKESRKNKTAGKMGARNAVYTAMMVIFLVVFCGCAWKTFQDIRTMKDHSKKSLSVYKPQKKEEDGRMSFDDVLNLNEDTVAWVTVDNTGIDYPIMQAPDNAKYVNTNARGEPSIGGCPFLDCRNTPDFSDAYNIVYGHAMEGGVLFGDIKKFVDQGYLERHQTGTLMTKDGRVWDVTFFACVKTDAYDMNAFTNIKEMTDEIDAKFRTWMAEHVESYTEDPEEGNIISLSTCESPLNNGRILLYGRYVEHHETETVTDNQEKEKEEKIKK